MSTVMECGGTSGTTRLIKRVHDELLAVVPSVDRVACVLYEPADDLLKTFINSTRAGLPIKAYDFKLAGSQSLSRLAREGGFRIIENIQSVIKPDQKHSVWVLEQGYQTSLTVPIYNHGQFAGFIFYDSRKPAAFNPVDQRQLLLYADNIGLLISNELTSIQSLTGAVAVSRAFCNMRDFETGAHLDRMSRYSRMIAQELAPALGLSDEYVEHVYLFSPLHDLGKIGIPDSVLLKPGKLSDEEWRVMRSHPSKGRALLDQVVEDFKLTDMPHVDVMRNIVQHHHEMLDGTGYPAGLRGDAIPLEARITSVADIFDALTSRRSYKEAWTVEQAIAEMEKLAREGRLDARCVQALKNRALQLEAIRNQYSEAPA